jgi:DNA mismatch repair protein MLH3
MGSLAVAWGWKWQPWDKETQTLMVTHVPVICYRALTAADLKLYIHQLDDTAGCRLLPPGVHRLLASKACRSAIMFGDPLSKEQSRDLVRKLASTNLFFECAHGRPTVIPLVDLSILDATHIKLQSCISGDPSSSHSHIVAAAPQKGLQAQLGSGLKDRIRLALHAETL